MTRCLLLKQLLETLQVVNVDVRYRPVVKVRVSPIQIIQTAANQGKSFTGKIDNWRGKIELRVQSRFNSVLVGRSHIGQMIRHE
jgi:hypothetical protein